MSPLCRDCSSSAVGASVLAQRLRARGHSHDHQHDGEHDHGHDHDHSVSSRGVLGVGVAAGLLPCPSALVVLLSAIALRQIGFGFALIAAFSVGLAATITGIGLVAVLARRAFGRISLDRPLVRPFRVQRARDSPRRRCDHRARSPVARLGTAS